MARRTRPPGWTIRLAAVCLAMALTACTRAETAPPAATAVTGASVPAEEKPAPVPITIAPILGIPADPRFSLDDLLKTYAGSRNLTVVAEDDPTAVYHLKGRFSAVSTATVTTMVYVWTATDVSGHRVFRFAGQQVSGGTVSDPWITISGGQLGEAARDTIDTFADWVRRQGTAKPLQ